MMKKKLMLCLYVALALVVNCDNEPYEGELITEDNSCILAIQATANAAENLVNATTDSFNLMCQIYKDAIEDQIVACGDSNGVLQDIIDGLACVPQGNLCDAAIENTAIAQENYENASTLDEENLCNAYRQALANQIEICGDENGALQSIINELGSCEPEFVETPGNWKLVSWLNDQSLDIDNDGVVTNDYLEEIDCYNNETITFNADGTGIIYLRSEADFTYTPVAGSASDVDFFVTCNIIDETKSFTWSQNGNSIVIDFADGSSTNYFRNANSIFIAIPEGFTATNTQNSNETIVEPVTYVYVKL